MEGMRPPQMSLQWVMALVAVLAVLFGLGAQFGLYVLAPSIFLALVVIVSPPGRRSPIALIAWFSGALSIPFAVTALTSWVLCGYYWITRFELRGIAVGA